MTSPVEPGTYEHYKGGKYRVLFTAPWWGTREPLKPDTLIYVRPHTTGAVVGNVDTRMPFLMYARWSGNGDYRPEVDEPIVIYVALYGEGRVAARTLWEFTQVVEGGKRRFEKT